MEYAQNKHEATFARGEYWCEMLRNSLAKQLDNEQRFLRLLTRAYALPEHQQRELVPTARRELSHAQEQITTIRGMLARHERAADQVRRATKGY